tara:strand:- start:299 stop:709 length:411 start_codon:yes stop_codon:yes gene_type:complete
MNFLQVDPLTHKEQIKTGEVRHFLCFLPLPNGKERIELGGFFYEKNIDPRGDQILTLLDQDDLEEHVKSLEHDAPDSTPEEFWEAYDLCRVKPHRLIWELLSPEASLLDLEMQEKIREKFDGKSFYEFFSLDEDNE